MPFKSTKSEPKRRVRDMVTAINFGAPESTADIFSILSDFLVMLDMEVNKDMLTEWGEWREKWVYTLHLCHFIDTGLLQPAKKPSLFVTTDDGVKYSDYFFMLDLAHRCFDSMCAELDIPYMKRYYSLEEVLEETSNPNSHYEFYEDGE